MTLRKASGNMYGWVGLLWNPIGGACPHECCYCSIQLGRAKMSGFYKGPIRLMSKVLEDDLGKGNTIFVCSNNDLFADGVEASWVKAILSRCREFPENKYVFQTKNPGQAEKWDGFPPDYLIGTTIETNRPTDSVSKAPKPSERAAAILRLREKGMKVFVTVEPIMDFDIDILPVWLANIRPEFVNVGADSKGANLHEPSADKIGVLISRLQREGIEVRQKPNLQRIFK